MREVTDRGIAVTIGLIAGFAFGFCIGIAFALLLIP